MERVMRTTLLLAACSMLITTTMADAQPLKKPNLPSSEQKASKAPVGVRWEYRVEPAHAIVKMGDGSVQAGLNKLGADSWELAGLEQGRQGTETVYIFRRPALGLPNVD